MTVINLPLIHHTHDNQFLMLNTQDHQLYILFPEHPHHPFPHIMLVIFHLGQDETFGLH